jgi:crotonobetainyl-CoA:carnitine CoA-transferase CaiB-like acyl-CoA transferase
VHVQPRIAGSLLRDALAPPKAQCRDPARWSASGADRLGTASQITCPYQSFQCRDGQIMIAVGNDAQFSSLCKVLGHPGLANDDRFATNPLRARHRLVLVPLLSACFAERSVRELHAACERAGVPCGPINDLAQVFDDPQVRHREVRRQMPHPTAGTIPVIANPIKFSGTPVEYRRPPPLLGEHTAEVLRELLGLSEAELSRLAADRVI